MSSLLSLAFDSGDRSNEAQKQRSFWFGGAASANFASFFVGLINGLTGVFMMTTDFIGGLVEGIMNAIGSLFGADQVGTMFVDVFRGLRDALVLGISNMLQAVIDLVYKIPYVDKLLGDKPVISASQEGRLNNVQTKLEYGSEEAMGDVAKREMGDLTSEQQVQLANAVSTGQVQALNDSLGARLDLEAQEMREMIAVLNAIAKNTGMTQQEIINLTKE